MTCYKSVGFQNVFTPPQSATHPRHLGQTIFVIIARMKIIPLFDDDDDVDVYDVRTTDEWLFIFVVSFFFWKIFVDDNLH